MHTLRIGYLSTMYHTAHLLRPQQRVEQALGIPVEWHLFGTGPAMVAAFADGALDLGYIGLPPAMIGIGRGVPLVCIAGGHVEGTVMIGRAHYLPADACPDTAALLRQFAGRAIGAPTAGSIHDVIARHLLAGCPAATAEMRNYAWADLMPDALARGEIHAAFGTPPLAVVAGRDYGHRILLPPDHIWPWNPSYGIVCHNRLCDEPALLEDFLRLHEAAENEIRLEPAAAAAIVADAVKVVDAAFVQQVFALSPRYCAALPGEYIDASMAFVPVLQHSGYLSADLVADQVFDPRFITAVHPEPAHYR